MKHPQRYELKFILNEMSYAQAISWTYANISIQEKYPSRNIFSLYYDTPDLAAAQENLAGLSNRQKIRLRWYTSLEENSRIEPKIEFKIRSGRLNHKINLALPEEGIECIENNRSNKALLEQVQLSLDAELHTAMHLFPSLFVQYQRQYFESHSGIRVTFDKNIQFRQTPLYAPIISANLVNYAPSIMEIKFSPEQYHLAAHLLKRLNLVPKRHSKYVAGLASFHQFNYF